MLNSKNNCLKVRSKGFFIFIAIASASAEQLWRSRMGIKNRNDMAFNELFLVLRYVIKRLHMNLNAKKIITGLIFATIMSTVAAQIPKSVEIEVSDPRATGILEAAKDKVEEWNAIKVNFTVQIEIPDQHADLQKGTLIQKQNQYRLDLPDRLIICDGKSMWSYLKNANEVQILDVDEDGEDDFQTPLDWLRIYDNPEYYYALTDQVSSGGQNLDLIEFKPRNMAGDLSKFRLTMKSDNIPQKLEFFYRDGVKMSINLLNFSPEPIIAEGEFTFNKADFPGIHIEDLRF